MTTPIFLTVLAASVVSAGFAYGQAAATGTFTAKQACPATQSIRDRANAGAASVQPGQSYQLVGKNKPDGDFLQIIVDGRRRWVDLRCGATDTARAAAPASTATYVLALSWQPAFCSAHADKAECHDPAGTASTRSLSLHGLWPQPRGRAYCNVDPSLVQADKAHAWDRLPEPDLRPDTRRRLAAVMPGVQSGLQRHEWIVHGTCSGLSADAYFGRAVDLADQVNASSIPAAFASHVGQTLSAEAIAAAFGQAFGADASARVTVLCNGRGSARRITELDVSLAGDVTGSAGLADLIRAAAPVPPGCPSGVVERPGS